MSDNTVTLSKPLKTHGGDLNKLTLREPTARAFIENGEPFKMRNTKGANGEPAVEFDYDNGVFVHFLVEMIAEDVDDLVLKGLRASDFLELRVKATHLILGLTGSNPT